MNKNNIFIGPLFILFISSVSAISWGVCGDLVLQSGEGCDNLGVDSCDINTCQCVNGSFSDGLGSCIMDMSCTGEEFPTGFPVYFQENFWTPAINDHYDICCIDERVNFDVNCTNPEDMILNVQMEVDEDYKVRNNLTLGYMEYEEEGLSELNGKCLDCENIVGIVTEYDDINVTVEIPITYIELQLSTGYDPSELVVEFDLYGISGLEQEISLGSCDIIDDKYVCSVLFDDSLTREFQFYATVRLLDDSGNEVLSGNSDKFLVAKYVFQMFAQDMYGMFPTDIMKLQYRTFVSISVVNKNMKYSGKYLIRHYDLKYVPRGIFNPIWRDGTEFGVRAREARNLANGFGFDAVLDKSVVYVNGYRSCTRMMDPSVFISVTENPNEWTLAHEFGHSYSKLADEYDLETWDGHITYQGSLNPRGLDGSTHFPLCCVTEFSCYSYIRNNTLKYAWSSDQIVQNSINEGRDYNFTDASDSFCTLNGIRPCLNNISSGNCQNPYPANPAAFSCGEIYAVCQGMPYEDIDATQPDDVNDLNLNIHSIMGYYDTPGFRVYPNEAVCPLRHCD